MSTNGCKVRKCPCRLWVNCATYVDIQRQARRLKKKKHDIGEWYHDNFREDINCPDIASSG